ncbi:MAG: hypothetical protein MUE44_32405, partial [Oscillatoriaceae cyanobacterium Prado104]|nr:hypothetical protein [Oscillatoriaceae cyanobacterium Prado104]
REVANLLGWKKEKVTHVAKRLRKKGLGDRIKVQNLEEQILEKLRQSTEPISAYQIAQEYLSINAPWISIKLGKLVKLGLVRVIERKLQPYLYELMEESNENSNS